MKLFTMHLQPSINIIPEYIMSNLFEIGDIVRLKPRGHKMVVFFIYTPDGTGIYLPAYQSMKLQHPSADYFYVCKTINTGKTINKIYPEDLLEKVI